jgi:hypothetical protein
MQRYIGTKVVLARPMTRQEYLNYAWLAAA